jgi:hypothetical protein
MGRPWPENRPKHQGTTKTRTTPTTTAAGPFRTLELGTATHQDQLNLMLEDFYRLIMKSNDPSMLNEVILE